MSVCACVQGLSFALRPKGGFVVSSVAPNGAADRSGASLSNMMIYIVYWNSYAVFNDYDDYVILCEHREDQIVSMRSRDMRRDCEDEIVQESHVTEGLIHPAAMIRECDVW